MNSLFRPSVDIPLGLDLSRWIGCRGVEMRDRHCGVGGGREQLDMVFRKSDQLRANLYYQLAYMAFENGLVNWSVVNQSR